MIKKRNNSYGLNTNVHVDPSASANASPNITNHIYIRDMKKTVPREQQLSFNASAVSENNVMTRDIQLEQEQPEATNTTETTSATEQNTEVVNETHTTTTPVKKPQKIYAREVIITTETNKQEEQNVKVKTPEQAVLETYAKILLDQNKALLLNLISKQTIIVPRTDLEEIVKAKTGMTCQITLVDDVVGCCLAKYSHIKKI